MTGRPRTSTLVLSAVFVATSVLYLAVRPEPEPRRQLVPAVEVPATAAATTIRPPAPTTSRQPATSAPEEDPRTTSPAATEATMATTTTTADAGAGTNTNTSISPTTTTNPDRSDS